VGVGAAVVLEVDGAVVEEPEGLGLDEAEGLAVGDADELDVGGLDVGGTEVPREVEADEVDTEVGVEMEVELLVNMGPKYEIVKPAGVAVSSTKKTSGIVVPSTTVRADEAWESSAELTLRETEAGHAATVVVEAVEVISHPVVVTVDVTQLVEDVNRNGSVADAVQVT